MFSKIFLTVMESDLSSSDAALRTLFVEDVELVESGIFRLGSLYWLSFCGRSGSMVLALSKPLSRCCVPTVFLFFFSTTEVSPFYGIICLPFLTSNTLNLINQCAESISLIPIWSVLYSLRQSSFLQMFGTFSLAFMNALIFSKFGR